MLAEIEDRIIFYLKLLSFTYYVWTSRIEQYYLMSKNAEVSLHHGKIIKNKYASLHYTKCMVRANLINLHHASF